MSERTSLTDAPADSVAPPLRAEDLAPFVRTRVMRLLQILAVRVADTLDVPAGGGATVGRGTGANGRRDRA